MSDKDKTPEPLTHLQVMTKSLLDQGFTQLKPTDAEPIRSTKNVKEFTVFRLQDCNIISLRYVDIWYAADGSYKGHTGRSPT